MAGMQRAFGFALVALGLTACDAASTASPKITAGQQVTVTVEPGSTQLAPGATRQFTATVTGSINTAVQWTVQEGGVGGAITSGGAYTAPASAGTYHVVATSGADPGASASAVVTVTPNPAVGVSVSPANASVVAGAQATFTATVTNAANAAVTWSVREATGCGSVTPGGVYTAPAAAATCHVVATSVQDGTRSASATVTVTGPPPVITVAVAPAAVSLDACASRTFTATVTGTTNTAVTWTVQEGAAGGTITGGGAYTAPATAGTYHLVATSSANGTSAGSSTVTVVERVLGVAVSPAVINVAPGGTAQFTATVTTTCGAFASLQTIDSAGQIVAPQ